MTAALGRLRRDRWTLVAVLAGLAAVALYLTRLGDVPPGLYQDEATNGYQGWAIAHFGRDEHGHLLPLYLETFGDWKSSVYAYLLAPFTYLLPLTPATIRLPAALCGLLTCLAITSASWWRTRSRPVTLLALLGAATMPWLLVQSRVGLEAVTLTAALAVALACLARAESGGGARWHLAAGAALGVAALAYPSGRAVAAPLAVVAALAHRGRGRPGALAVLAIPAAVYAAIGAWALQHPGALTARLDAVSIARDHPSPAVLVGRFVANYAGHLGPDFLLLRGDRNPRQSTGLGGLVLLALLPALVTGVVVASRRRRPLDLVLLATLFLAPVPSAVTDEGVPHALRAAAMIPALLLLAAVGWEVLLPWLGRHSRAAAALAAVAVLQSALVVADLEVTWPGRAEGAFDAGYDQAVADAVRLAGGHSVLLSDRLGAAWAHALVVLRPPPAGSLDATLAGARVRTVDAARPDASPGDVLVVGPSDPTPPGATLLEEVRVPVAFWGAPVVAVRLLRAG